jgi:methionyl aminopeptidase
MRLAGHTAAEVLRRTAEVVKAGMSTKAVDEAAGQFMSEAGCRSAFLGYRGFPGRICISLKIDVGITKGGWIGDNALTVAVGMVSPEVHQLLRVTEESLLTAVSHAVPGGQLRTLCGSVEKLVRRFGFSVVQQFVGHGVGKQLHEAPEVPNFDNGRIKVRLEPGMVLAIEPMVNVGTPEVVVLSDRWTAVTRDRKASSHFEHTVVVTEDGPEILTPRARVTAPLAVPAV